MKLVIGIDPGQGGGIARIVDVACGVEETAVIKMPETEADVYDVLYNLNALTVVGYQLHCYIERVHSMPKQGVSSSFKFGYNYGILIGILTGLRIPYTRITPQAWQKEMGCIVPGRKSERGTTEKKNINKRRAQELYPSFKITHATADALLIATYGMKCQTNQNQST